MANLNLHQSVVVRRSFAAKGDEALDAAWLASLPPPPDEGDVGIRFRRYLLLPRSRILLRDGLPVELGSRAFDLLHVLLTSRGAVVPKDDIVRRVWPATVVDDCNLRFQVAALRKALGDDRELIKTVSGRGYLFADEVRAEGSEAWPADGFPLRTRPPRLADPRFDQIGEADAPPCCAACTSPQRLAGEAGDNCETLRGLLRSVLDELWRMTLQGRRISLAAPSPEPEGQR
jgi:DNA-binding winged helix-turn-helix (wHTH) protein